MLLYGQNSQLVFFQEVFDKSIAALLFLMAVEAS
jgi:hypothetical protein